MTTTVGQFTMDAAGTISGPAAFMRSEDFQRWKQGIERGDDVVFNMGCTHSPNFETAILVSLQTTYAGWHGRETFFASMEREADVPPDRSVDRC